jgi:flagellar biosynthesis/type III secretory pathway protein FliH
MKTQDNFEQPLVTVSTYTPTPYEEVAWPVAEKSETLKEDFREAEYTTVSAQAEFEVDPIFPDFTQQVLEKEAQERLRKQAVLEPEPTPEFQIRAEETATPEASEPQSADLEVTDPTAEHNVPQDSQVEQIEPETAEDQSLVDSEVSLEAPDSAVEDADSSLETQDSGVKAVDSSQDDQIYSTIEADKVELEPEILIEPDSAQKQPQPEKVQIEEAALKQALEESYAKGCHDTRAEVEISKRQLEESYTLLWEDMQTQLTEAMQTNERRAVELAFQIAKKMVGNVVDTHREYVVSVIREALQAAGSAEIKSVRVSPQDYEFLALNGYGERVKIHGDSKLLFISDETIRAGCIVETSSGQIDFDLDKAWARVHGKVFQGPQS